VIDGAKPPIHFILAGQVTALAVPSAVKIKVNVPPLPLAGGLLIVKVVIAAFSETAKMLDVSRFSTSVPAEIVGLEIVSE
jgi:hypothetical protein